MIQKFPVFQILFQSYYSLISNSEQDKELFKLLLDFNPIIVLFLTGLEFTAKYGNSFQSYYSLISNEELGSSDDEEVDEFQSYYSLISNFTDKQSISSL